MPTFSYDPVAVELPKALEKPTRIFKGDVSCLEMLGETMKVLRKLLNDTDGQGLVEYTLIVFLVAFVFWVKDTTAGTAMGDV